MYISIIAKIDNQINGVLDLLGEIVNDVGSETDSYFAVLNNYDNLKNKRDKILTKLGEIKINKISEIYDEAGYCLFEECEIVVCGKTHKNIFFNNDILPNGEEIGFFTKKTDLDKVARYYV